AVDDRHLIGAQPDLGPGHALPGRHVELEPVPGARDDLALVTPGQLPAGHVAVDERAGGGAGTQGAALMRAEVRQRVQRAADVEDAELAIARANDRMAAGRQVGREADPVALLHLRHRAGSYFAGISIP